MNIQATIASKKAKVILASLAALALLLGGASIYQILYVERAHSSFKNYYAFRGCQQLLTKTETYATCRLGDDKTIKIVKYQNKWYLDGDLPVCYFGNKVCL